MLWGCCVRRRDGMRRRAVVSALLLFTTAEASAFAPSTSLISISARSGQAHASGSFARTGASAGGVRMGMERWMPLWRRVLQGPKRLNLVGPFASKAEGIGGRKGGLQNTVQTREVAKAKEEKSVPRLTKAWELLRDIYGQFMVLIFDTLINRPFLHILNKVAISNHERLTDLISNRERGVPLITVSNHCSSLDEPLLFSALIPWPIKQWELRYSLCNDGMFYSLGPIFAELFFYAARGFPIWRSRSINQPSFRAFCDKARDGGWCHIFPEGRIWQPWKLQNKGQKLGDLRPGVGKLISHCDTSSKPPIILPFYHTGMHRVLPQYPNSKRQSFPPKVGNTIRIRVGEPIDVSDLLDEHREAREAERRNQGITNGWTSTSADQALYDKLTKRIEEALLSLAEEVDAELEWQTHPSVLPQGMVKKT